MHLRGFKPGQQRQLQKSHCVSILKVSFKTNKNGCSSKYQHGGILIWSEVRVRTERKIRLRIL